MSSILRLFLQIPPVIKTMWNCQQDRHRDQRDRKKEFRNTPQSTRDTKVLQPRKDSIPPGRQEPLHAHTRKTKPQPRHWDSHENQLKMYHRLKCKRSSCNTFKRKHRDKIVEVYG